MGEEITSEGLHAMRYARAVAKEGLRWKMPVSGVYRGALCTFQKGLQTILEGGPNGRLPCGYL